MHSILLCLLAGSWILRLKLGTMPDQFADLSQIRHASAFRSCKVSMLANLRFCFLEIKDQSWKGPWRISKIRCVPLPAQQVNFEGWCLLLTQHSFQVRVNSSPGVGKNVAVDRVLQLLRAEREYVQLHRDTTATRRVFEEQTVGCRFGLPAYKCR